jgi:hypothetical protein
VNAEFVLDGAPKLKPFVLGFSEFELNAENGFADFEVVEGTVVEVAPKPRFEQVFEVLVAPNPTFVELAELNGFVLTGCTEALLPDPNALVLVELAENGFFAAEVVCPPNEAVVVCPAKALANAFGALFGALFLAAAAANGFCILCKTAQECKIFIFSLKLKVKMLKTLVIF